MSKDNLLKIEVDFDTITQDEHWRRLPLDAEDKPEILNTLQPGQRVVLFAENDMEIEAETEYDSETKRWYGVPDWRTVHYYRLDDIPHNADDRDKLLRIYVDFNTMMTDPRQRVHIPTHVRRDLLDVLRPDMRVIIFEPNDLEVEAVLVFDESCFQKPHCWYALPDRATLRYLDE